jgi:hypothetical protein
MSVDKISLALGISEYELFVRAHRNFGPPNRTTIDRDFRRYEISGAEPDYVRGFCIAHMAEISHAEDISGRAATATTQHS